MVRSVVIILTCFVFWSMTFLPPVLFWIQNNIGTDKSTSKFKLPVNSWSHCWRLIIGFCCQLIRYLSHVKSQRYNIKRTLMMGFGADTFYLSFSLNYAAPVPHIATSLNSIECFKSYCLPQRWSNWCCHFLFKYVLLVTHQSTHPSCELCFCFGSCDGWALNFSLAELIQIRITDPNSHENYIN